METKPQTTSQTRAPAATRICERPGCTTELGALNRSGRCAAHFHWKGTEKRSSSAGNGHPAAGNGIEPKATNGSNGVHVPLEVIPDLAADRVDQLILSLPVADKTRLALAWLTRAI